MAIKIFTSTRKFTKKDQKVASKFSKSNTFSLLVLPSLWEKDSASSLFFSYEARTSLMLGTTTLSLKNIFGKKTVTLLIIKTWWHLIISRVTVFLPNIFFNDKVVVHGISDVLTSQDKNNEVVEPLSRNGDNTDEENMFDPTKFWGYFLAFCVNFLLWRIFMTLFTFWSHNVSTRNLAFVLFCMKNVDIVIVFF